MIMIVRSIKKITPSFIKNTIKFFFDIFDWVVAFKKVPIVLENSFNIKFLMYPWNTTFMRLATSAHDHKKEFLAFDKLIKSGDIVFDIGANIGMMSVYFSRLVKENGHVYSFEPVSDTHGMLLETLALNRCKNVNVHQLALSDSKGFAEIYKFDQRHHTLNSLGKVKIGESMPTSTEHIKTETLDNFCQVHSISKIDFLKVDVEGFEDNVFKGASNFLKGNLIRCIQFEISKMPLTSIGKSYEDIFDILHLYKYDIYRFNLEKSCFEGPIHKIDNDFDNYYASQSNLTNV